MSKPIIFVSHIHEDKDFAKALKLWLDESFLGAVSIFVSSSPDSLPPGSDWPHELKKALESASITILLMSPHSIERRWIYFEAGAAYVKGLPVVPTCIAGSSVSDLMPPLSFLQAIDLNNSSHRANLLKMIAASIGLHTPKTEDVVQFPDRVEIKQASSVRSEEGHKYASDIDKPITAAEARRLVKDFPQDIKLLLNELITIINLESLSGNSDKPVEVLASLKKMFASSQLISPNKAEEMIAEAEVRYKNLKSDKNEEDNWMKGYAQVRCIVATVSEYGLSRQDAIDKLLELPDYQVVPFLISQYHSGKWHHWTKNIIFDLLVSGGYEQAPLHVIGDYLQNNDVGSRDFNRAVYAARQILDDFDLWYEKLRGISFSEDIRRHEELELKKRELELKERMQRDEYELRMAKEKGVKQK